MVQKFPVTIFIDGDQEIEAVRLRPAAAGLSEKSGPRALSDASSHPTMKVTDLPDGSLDSESDITFDL